MAADRKWVHYLARKARCHTLSWATRVVIRLLCGARSRRLEACSPTPLGDRATAAVQRRGTATAVTEHVRQPPRRPHGDVYG